MYNAQYGFDFMSVEQENKYCTSKMSLNCVEYGSYVRVVHYLARNEQLRFLKV